ncbi:MAG: hypothetical protein FWD67_04185, partial [Betaproteobacteria bacterium]|nr:hypothetical protein [Betaproteobacteria bacterium]
DSALSKPLCRAPWMRTAQWSSNRELDAADNGKVGVTGFIALGWQASCSPQDVLQLICLVGQK